jgi:hypothetical protein
MTLMPAKPPRAVYVHNLVGYREIADSMNVQIGTVRIWRYRHRNFPKPLVTLANGPIWDWYEIRQWLDLTARLPPLTMP